ncbi:hypothetical protein RJ640_006645 [Escallonia rubra]|uniref:F-box domain-containing protein n=1 Tax=Escallonia rubra TaxID=112253 RepID=A0AA88UR52_9ASTE|nr:hypothetical protein RJ640_006645 [Escallonia rubra]
MTSDHFDRLPDPLLLLIFNATSDIKTLIRCRAVSRRFNALVPQSDSLVLRVDRVISPAEPDDDDGGESFFLALLRSVFKSLHELVSPKHCQGHTARPQNSPTRILRGFERIRELEIELPTGDLKLEKGASIRWRAEFGKTLKSCVILGFRSVGGGGENETVTNLGGGLKMRVVWTISALIAASARHYMVKEVATAHGELRRLVVRDREGEGTVVMDEVGLREWREEGGGGGEEEDVEVGVGGGGGGGVWWRNNRTPVPAVRMRMRHEARLELGGGVRMEGATLVVVRPVDGGGSEAASEEEQGRDAELACGAFGGVYGEAVERLLKSRSYLLEMNSF